MCLQCINIFICIYGIVVCIYIRILLCIHIYIYNLSFRNQVYQFSFERSKQPAIFLPYAGPVGIFQSQLGPVCPEFCIDGGMILSLTLPPNAS